MAQDNPFGDLLPQARQSGPIMSPVDPYKQSGEVRAQEDQSMDRMRLQMEAERLRIAQEEAAAKAAKDAAEQADKGKKFEGSRTSASVKLARVIEQIDAIGKDAKDNGGWFETGTSGAFSRDVLPKGTAGFDLGENVKTIDANSAFAALQEMRDNSPTGGALGQVTEKELELLKSQIANLNPDQSQEQFLQNLSLARQAYMDMLGRVDPEAVAALQVPQDNEQGGIVGSVTDNSPNSTPTDPNAPVDGNSPAYAQFAAGLGDIVEGGLNNTVGLVSNPLSTILGQALGYDGTANIGATVREGLGLPYGDPTIGAINQAAAGGLGMASAARGLSNLAGGATRNALADFGSRPGLDMVTGGAAAASGEMASQMGAGPIGQAAATIVGGATPSAISGLRRSVNALNPSDLDRNVIAAGQRQNVPVRLPDASPSRRGDMANIAQTPNGGPIVQAARNADAETMEARVTGLSDGASKDNYALGQTVQGAANRHKARTKAEANRLYSRAQAMAGDAKVSPAQATQALDGHISELKAAGENANAGAIKYLEGLRADLGKGLDIKAMQNLRSNMRGQINERSLTGTDTERRVGDVIGAMNRDLAEQLPDGAAQALDAADQFYRGRMEFIKQVSERFLGPKNNPVPAETAASRLLSMVNGKGDADRFSSMWKELEPGERTDLSATIAASLGRKANGEFSLSTLVRSLDPEKGINPRTARLVFGEDGAKALADLRTLANAKTATQQAMNNSNTGATVTRAAGGLKTLMLGAMGYSAGGPAGAVAGAVSRDFISRLGEQRAARLLLNPDFTKMLKNAPNTANPAAIDGWFRQVTKSAAKAPVYAGDVKALQAALAEAFSKSPRAVAASETEQEQN